MKTIDYIKEHGLQALTDNLGITIKRRGGLILLDYSQIDSPKTDPIVGECRGIILEEETLAVKSRPFDRYFNYGECFTDILLDKAIENKSNIEYFPKLDGSLIKVYYYNDKWNICTRGTIIADNETTFGSTFQDLVLKAMDLDSLEAFDLLLKENNFNPAITYILEVTSIENRIVTRYEGYTATFLAARYNETGVYCTEQEREKVSAVGIKLLDAIKFESIEQINNVIKQFKNLEEGFVIYIDGIPSIKIKSEAYVVVHHTRGNGMLTPKHIKHLILTNEYEEYLNYFEEDKPLFEPYIKAYKELFIQLEFAWKMHKDIESQKDFALTFKNVPYQSLMFGKRKQPDISFIKLLQRQSEKSQHDLLEYMLNYK